MEAIVMTGGIRKMGSSVSTCKSHTVKITLKNHLNSPVN